ncbi:ATP-binding protein [Rhodanobacter sp. DHG33]|uniref:sensor histidine kinase n=1 Tax=Rhodanobacter sp. DHG33 TaxID=2775921 RepID=UPI001785EA25|nr:ATP-binding protein [Rhodanobacter sp. DHG33]MBD8897501.1 histidine kinase [Rhodanobacter sp. DHG33]
MARLRVVVLLGLLAALTACARHAHERTEATHPVLTLTQAEAVRSDWNAAAPPATGWVPVKLMDYWDKRWPRHDGVVWYRLHWNQTDANAPVGILLDYVCMADEVWVNGSLLYRDTHLVEPLSRSWIVPQHFMLDRPLLRAGENTLLVRASGLAAYQPGLGTVSIGAPATIRASYEQAMFWRFNIHLFNFALSTVLGVLFLMFWLLRRRETVFGWYALTTLFGAAYDWNFVASSTWPLASTDAWEGMNAAMFLASATTFCVFLLRFCELRWRRTEAALLAATVAALLMALFAPHAMGVWRNVWIVPTIALDYVAILAFQWHAVRTPRADLRVMAACLAVPVLVSLIDLLVFFEILPAGNNNLGAVTSPLTLVGMGFAVAWRFSAAMRRVEGFNIELRHEVEVATAQLSDTLSREHTLALANTRIGERLNLVRDLHDGFGGSLLGAITTLEQSPPSPETTRTVATLKELRDDLRLVIDTTTHEQDTDLAGLLAPLRHRWSQRLEAAGIDSRWQLDDLDDCRLGAMRSLDLLRFLQEALTNVLKHSGASKVHVDVQRSGDHLRAGVRDDGRGFDPANHGSRGAGLASMQSRAARLGGRLELLAIPGSGASVGLDMLLP